MADSTIQPASSSTSANKAVVRTTKPAATHPKFLDMVMEAIIAQNDRKGVSLSAIKSFIATKYTSVDPNSMKFNVKRAMEKGIKDGLIIRPKAHEESRGMTGRFKLDKVKYAGLTKPKPKPKAKEKAKQDKEKTKPKKPAVKKTTTKAKSDVGKSPRKLLKTPKKTKSKSSKTDKTEKPKTQKANPAGKTSAKTRDKTAKAKTVKPTKKASPKSKAKKSK